MTGSIAVRSLGLADLDGVVDVHLRSFPRGALTRLGPRLVGRYYLWQLTGPHDVVAFAALRNDTLIGFVIAGRFQRALSGFVNLNRRLLALRLASRPWLLADPHVRERLVRARRWSLRRNLPPLTDPPISRSVFGVLAIAVDPHEREGGIGRALLDAVEAAALNRGLERLHLTVEPSNEGAIAFYERVGWIRLIRDGGWRGEMEKELDPQRAAADNTDW